MIPRTWSAVAACGETFVVLAEQPISALLYWLCVGQSFGHLKLVPRRRWGVRRTILVIYPAAGLFRISCFVLRI